MPAGIVSWFNSPLRIAAAGALSVIAIAAAAGGYLVLGPAEYDFSQNQKISATAPFRLAFAADMNHESVEQYLTLPEGVEVSKEWKDEVLVLQPLAKLTPDTTYVVRVDGKALTKEGTALGTDLEFTFIVTGAPVVAAQIPPANSAHVPEDADITLVFDRPVVPLTQVQGASADNRLAGWPVTVSPTLKGRWRWLGTTTASFIPEKPLTIATKYTVNVPIGITTVSGETTEKDFSWSFETERPAVGATFPRAGSADSGPGTEITLTFNHEMDLISAKDFIVISEKSGANNVTDRTIGIGAVKYGTTNVGGIVKKLVTDKKKIRITPAEPLKFNKHYLVTVRAGIRGLVGDLGSASDFNLNFSSVGPFTIVRGQYRDGSVSIDFSSPVDGKDIEKAISISPNVPSFSEIDFSAYGDQLGDDVGDRSVSHLYLYPQLEPSTTYTITLKETLVDHYGQKLGKPYALTFTTPELSPRVFIHPEGKNFGIFEKGKPPVYFVNDVNVSVLNVEFGSLPFQKFTEMRRGILNGSRQSLVDAKSIVENYQSIQMKPKSKKNEWEALPLDIEKTFGTLKPGLYFLAVRAPEWFNNYGLTKEPYQEERTFAITNMAMTLKYSRGKALVWVTDLQTGDPVAGAAVNFRSVAGKTEASGKTDKDGFFETVIDLKNFKNQEYDWQPEFWVTAEKNGDFAFIGSDWNSGVQPYDFDGIYSDFRSPDAAAYRMQSVLYTERPLYGAGDTVFFKGVARMLDDDGILRLPGASRSAYVSVQDTNGTKIYSKTLKLTEYGSFHDSFALSAEAPLGMYSIQASLTPDADIEGSSYASFSVLAYRKPEYKVSVTSEKEEYANKDAVTVDVTGDYYFGAPMSGAKVTWRLQSTDYYFNKFTDGWYSFALDDAWCWRNCDRGSNIVSSGEAVLDAAGRLKLPFSVNIDDKSVSQVMTIEADITDQNNQVVSQRGSFAVHKSNIYVGVRSDDYGIPAGGTADIKVVTVDTEGKLVPNTQVTISLFSRHWNVVQQKGVDGEYYYDSEPEDIFIRSENVVTNDEGKITADVKLDKAGEYRVVVTAADSTGREAKAGWSVYAWGDTYFNWPRSNNDRVDIVLDKPEYKVGDTAKLIVKSPYQGTGVKALVTIERENVISKRIVDVTSNALPIEVEVTEDLIPTAYVSVVIIKPRIGETFNENGLDTGAPAFKVGYAKLIIDASSKKLDIKITTDKERYVPGEKVNVDLLVKDAQGKPVEAELSVGVVDLSLLDLTGFEMPDWVTLFYYERGLGVQTANMLTYLTERFKPGSKGGGGDGEEKKRGNFLDTAYWNPSIVTDKEGRATTSFTLPDNLTTWQILALGSTKNTLVGGFAKNIIETKRVILRPVRPRFGVGGDQVILSAIVHNYLEEERSFTVKLGGTGFTHSGKAEQTVRIGKDSQAKIDFPVKVSDVQTMTMNFTATTDGARDEIEESIPVYRFGVEQTNATAHQTENQETEKISVPTKADAPDGKLRVTVAPTLAIYLPTSLEFLATFPYGCAEQTVSSFVPNIALSQLKSFDQFSTISAPNLEKNVQTGLQTLYKFQRPDGGFGYWEGSGRSYPYLTAYILHALKMTKDAGYAVDNHVIDRALPYLKSALKNGKVTDFIDDRTRVYGYFVLSEFGTNDIPALNFAYKTRLDLPLFSRAYLAMAYKNAKNDDRAQEILEELLGHVKIDPRGAHFEEADNRSGYSMNTDHRTTAIVLQALVRIEPDHALMPRVIRGMLSSRVNGHWDTTQSTAMSVLSFVEYLKVSQELEYDQQVGVEVDGKKKLTAAFKAPAMEQKEVVLALSELPRGKDIDVSIGKTGPGNLYYDVILSYFYTPDVIVPAEEGIGILRETTPLTKSDASMKVGTTQKVTLTITVPQTRHFVAVESMLPGGYEPIDLQFATSQKNLLDDATNVMKSWRDYRKNQLWRFSHIEYRDDRIFMFAEELPPGVYTYEYLVRLTTPGKFRERPAKVWEMYFPEVFGQSAGSWVQIGQ